MMQMQDTSPSVVFIKDLELAKGSNDSTKVLADDDNAKVEGTGSGFIWDEFGHIVRLFDSVDYKFAMNIQIFYVNWMNSLLLISRKLNA